MKRAPILHILIMLVALACIPVLAQGLEYEPLDAWVRVVDVSKQYIDGESMLLFTTYITNTGSEHVSVHIKSLGLDNGSFTSNICSAAGDASLAPGQMERVVGCFPHEYVSAPILIMIAGLSEGPLPAHVLPFTPGACDWAIPANISCQHVQSVSHLERFGRAPAVVDSPADSSQGPVLEYAYYNPDHLVLVFDRPILLGDGWERNIVLYRYSDEGGLIETWSGEWHENQILANVMVSRIPDHIEYSLVHPTTLALSVTVGHGALVDAEGNPGAWAVVPVTMPDTRTMSESITDMQDVPSHSGAEPCPDCPNGSQDTAAQAPAESALDDAQATPQIKEYDPAAQWRQYLLDLINEERRDVGLDSVMLGDNPAAQAHADSMLANCFSSHWGLNGLKPYMRYSLAGGYQYNAENVSGLSYCIKPWENYVKTSLERDIKEAMAGLMASPGHRDNILDPHHARVNLGLAWDDHNMMIVQHFEHGYVSFAEQPTIRGDILSFSGTAMNGAGFRSNNDLQVQIYYDPPPRDLSVGQVIRTYCYDNGRVVAALVPPLPPGYFYTDDSYQSASTPCPDPYDVAADAPAATSPAQAHDIWYESYVASSSTTTYQRVPYHDVTLWEISGDDFTVSANLKPVLEKYGPGVYTIVVWGVIGDQNTPIAGHSVFYGIDIPRNYG